VTERNVAQEDIKEGEHKRSRKLQEQHQVGAHGNGATKRVKMLGRARTTWTGEGRDIVGSRVRSEGAIPAA
jgi:hypothetical protein